MRGAGAGGAKATLTAIVHRPNWAGYLRLHDVDDDEKGKFAVANSDN